MKFEARLFLWLTPFFVIVAVAYGWWSGWEPVGTAALLLVGGLVVMIGAYLALVARRIDPRPEDDPYAEIEQGAGSRYDAAASAACLELFRDEGFVFSD